MADLIDRQAAIDICTSAIDLWSGQLGEGALVAVRNKIAELPSALGTNLAEVGTDCISRQAVMLRVREFIGNPSYTEKMLVDELNGLPPAQPNNDLQNLAEEIATFKRSFKSVNSDYFTGYMSALSLVEGMIAEREVTE